MYILWGKNKCFNTYPHFYCSLQEHLIISHLRFNYDFFLEIRDYKCHTIPISYPLNHTCITSD